MKNYKEALVGFVSAAMLLTCIMIPGASAADGIRVMLGGSEIAFDVPPQIINERTMVPLRAIFEALGASVDWDGSTQTVSAKRGDTNISLKINDNTMYVNSSAVALDSPACIIDERTLVPVRAISEAFGAGVDWDGSTQTVTITVDNASAPVSYVDISSNVNEINNYINSGMYLEAMQACENAKTLNISPGDVQKLNDLYNTAKSKYDSYLSAAPSAFDKLKNAIMANGTVSEGEYRIINTSSAYDYLFGYDPSEDRISLMFMDNKNDASVLLSLKKNSEPTASYLRKRNGQEYFLMGYYRGSGFELYSSDFPDSVYPASFKVMESGLRLIETQSKIIGIGFALSDFGIYPTT